MMVQDSPGLGHKDFARHSLASKRGGEVRLAGPQAVGPGLSQAPWWPPQPGREVERGHPRTKGQEQSHPCAQQSWGPAGLASSPALTFWDRLSWPRFPHWQHKV